MRFASGSILVCVIVAAATCAYACGSESDPELGSGPGTGADDGGGNGFGTADGGEGGTGDAAPPVETCGGKPCANHTGPKDFSEPGAPPNAGALFGGGA